MDLKAQREYNIAVPILTPNQTKVLTPLYEDFQLIYVEGLRFGEVFRCKEQNTNQMVAIKILTIPENQKIKGVPSNIINHVSIIKMLNHINIVRLLKVIGTEDDVFLVFEYANTSLKRFITNSLFNNPLFGLKNPERDFLRQALSGLAYCHTHKILHRDLKPHNILLIFQGDSGNVLVKLSDFGAAKTIEPTLSPYSINMGNPCYKAPELLLGSTNYSTAIDIWSIGCIFAEMIRKKPLFSGKDEPKILAQIFCLLGTPTEETWPGVSSTCNFVEKFDPPVEPKDLALGFPNLKPAGLDLLSKMLCLCPNRRISADEALKHPYFRHVERPR